MNNAGWSGCAWCQKIFGQTSTPEALQSIYLSWSEWKVLSQADNPFKNRKEGSKEEVILGNQRESVLSSLGKRVEILMRYCFYY